jgi:hypothetical protein
MFPFAGMLPPVQVSPLTSKNHDDKNATSGETLVLLIERCRQANLPKVRKGCMSLSCNATAIAASHRRSALTREAEEWMGGSGNAEY